MRFSRSGVLWTLLAGSVVAGAGALASACSDDGENNTSGTQATGAGGSTSSSGMGGGSTTSSGMGGGGGGGPTPTVDCSPPAGAEGALTLTQIASGINRPLLVKAAPGDNTRLFVMSQNGAILVIRDGVLQPTPFLDIDDLVPNVSGGDERGLLGFAFHPDYAQNGRFFVHYSDAMASSDTRIAEYKRGANPDTADPVQVAMVLMQDQPEGNHNGGSIDFSPVDGFLYIGLGDGGGAGDQHGTIGNGQDLTTLLGKIVRIDVSTMPYSIPPGNMTGAGVAPEIWDYGLRNPYRMSFDACNGDLYMGDVGQGSWEEVNIEPAQQGNKNYGWRVMEGDECFNPPNNCDMTNKVLPAAAYSHNQGGCSVTGGYVYRGSAIPWLRGTYFYGDYCTGQVWTLRYENGVASAPVERTNDLDTTDFPIVGFGQDNQGEVYMTTLDGNVYRIDPE